MPPCSNVLIRRRIESPRRALLPLIGWASCFKSTSSVPRPPFPVLPVLLHVALVVDGCAFCPRTSAQPTRQPSPSPGSFAICMQARHLRGLCLSCFAAIPSCAPSSSSSSSSFSTQWRVKSVNRRRRQSVLQVAATTACLLGPAPPWLGMDEPGCCTTHFICHSHSLATFLLPPSWQCS